ncbi:PKD domain-containing protein [Dinghuibacter silviterrae]|uniref:PKD domain-containing protein n=1 Tax=Dinghuibacter silviterrae TaxID=1539049 RepID=A0A4R8DH06_9BACT|nr:PKD domain-containing protein [Dinghuibacter silviterrae]TDW96805.1 PKD domain-containing protein [Dinghuibacter silviterrae]
MNEANIQNRPVKTGSLNRVIIYLGVGILVLAGLVVLARQVFRKRDIEAHLMRQEIYLNEPLVYTDNTAGAHAWLWEFGNGDQSASPGGTYHFHKSGRYIVRVTIDGDLRQQFPVTVLDTVAVIRDTAIHITGPSVAAVGEQIRLEADGDANDYQWAFGETGRVDAAGPTVFYAYHLPGEYRVSLRTDKSVIPVYHIVTVTEPYKDPGELLEPGEGEMKIENDFRVHLQAIASGQDFNTNYYYLVHHYLCNGEKTSVQASDETGQKRSDFYSYTIGLTFTRNIVIDQVTLSIVPHTHCANLVTVQQHRTATH